MTSLRQPLPRQSEPDIRRALDEAAALPDDAPLEATFATIGDTARDRLALDRLEQLVRQERRRRLRAGE